MEIKELPPVAKNVYLECTKCETQRYFRVLTHPTATSAKMECEVCKCKKTLKIGAKKKATGTRKKAVRKTKAKDNWLLMSQQRGDRSAVSYSVKGSFQADDKISHPKFGLGFVLEVFPNKVSVLFEDSTKDLIHNRT